MSSQFFLKPVNSFLLCITLYLKNITPVFTKSIDRKQVAQYYTGYLNIISLISSFYLMVIKLIALSVSLLRTHMQSCVTCWQGYILRNVSFSDLVIV